MTDPTAVIQVDQLSKRFVIRKDKSLKERLVNATMSRQHREDFWALRGVDLTIDSGSTVGLIGPNGSGKSTLLKAIGGIIQPTSGTVRRRGRLAALLELGAGFHPDLTGRDNVYLNASILGLSTRQTDKYFDAIVDFSGIEKFIDTQVKFYSSGMYVRLAFAVAVHVDPDILLVDEVLAVGDEPFQRKCMDRIKLFQSEGRTIVLVTHALEQVVEICDRAVVLEHGEVIVDGSALEAVRTLRADFQALDAGNAGDTAPAARLVGVEALSADGSVVQRLAPGDDLVVRVTVEADEPLADPVIGVSLVTPAGQQVFATDTQLLGCPMEKLVGRRSVDVRLGGLLLGPGDYQVAAALRHGPASAVVGSPQSVPLTADTAVNSVGPVGVRSIDVADVADALAVGHG